ncbi:uncharacterized protein LOC120843478 [Ixodes scapularis]|uniref:uncharacterized protein LOC120843478 n=1 Tax=Ixodes scapularis TaxID=6945 RepID=UPI001C384A2A|nr:uncharacterized protein LOC120843478 [Ixodes scapularis]
MPGKRQYSEYLWNTNCKIPIRSKCRIKNRRTVERPTVESDDSENHAEDNDTPGQSQATGATRAATPQSQSCANSDGDNADAGHRACVDTAAAMDSAAESEDETGNKLSSSEDSPDPSSSEDSSDPSSSDSEDESDAPTSPNPGSRSELDELLYPAAKLSMAESLLMVMGHSLRHCSSKEATESVLKLIDSHLPKDTKYPTTKYCFFKHFAGSVGRKTRHFYCSSCMGYIGELGPSDGEACCNQCGMKHSENDLVKLLSYFFTLDLASQIREMLETSDGSILGKHRLSYDVTDVTESLGCSRLPLGADDLTVTFNTDGVPLFESSNFGIWPLLVQVNELPFRERMQKLQLFGLWFGSEKPSMNTFLVPFVKALNELSSSGISWTDKGGNTRVSKVFPGPCTVDTVARCELMQMTQFNGAYGCAWCEEPGEVVEKGKGHSRVYPAGAAPPKRRTHESFSQHARKARKGEPSCGVKGSSVLLLLSFFSFNTGFVVDYMHAVCSGFVRSTTFLWFKAKRRDAFNLRPFMRDMDAKMMGLQPIWEMSRLPRSLNVMKEWKSSEWRNWLLYYSPVVLKGILPSKYFNHWMQFVEIMHYLLGPSLCIQKLRDLRVTMFGFVQKYQELYGKEHVTYNTHLLIHLVDSAMEWGPPWGYSLYPFESINGKLGRLVKGTRYPHMQIVDKFSLLQALPRLWRSTSHQMGEGGGK